jgi:hypothetical protein
MRPSYWVNGHNSLGRHPVRPASPRPQGSDNGYKGRGQSLCHPGADWYFK